MSEEKRNAPPRYWFPKRYADVVQRLRVVCGFVLLVAFGLFSRPTVQSIEVGVSIALLGIALRAWSAGHLAKDAELATSGPYAYVRNPLYIGTLTAALGIVVASRSGALAIIFAVVFLLVYLPVIELEEQHLRDIFPEYDMYSRRVHRLFPLSRWSKRRRAFSWSLYRKNEEYKAFLGLMVAILWLGFKCWWQAHGRS